MSVVGAGVSRVVRRDFQLGPYTIPKNTMVWVPVQAMHSSAELWDQPEKYMPVSGTMISACLHPKNGRSKPCESNLVNSPPSDAAMLHPCVHRSGGLRRMRSTGLRLRLRQGRMAEPRAQGSSSSTSSSTSGTCPLEWTAPGSASACPWPR